jgi:hypothetical protein
MAFVGGAEVVLTRIQWLVEHTRREVGCAGVVYQQVAWNCTRVYLIALAQLAEGEHREGGCAVAC